MARLTEAELARKDTIDAIRTMVRLKYRIAMRRILNDIEAEVLAEFDDRLAAGESFRLDVRSVLDEVEASL